jgi:oligopeptide transport system ATP-binding protein
MNQATSMTAASPSATDSAWALDIRNLRTTFPGAYGRAAIVDDVSLRLHPGEMLAVVGESGSGKSMSFMSALGLVAPPGRVESGQVLVHGTDLLKLSPQALRAQRGATISMIFQDPLSGLNPVFTVGQQIVEVLQAHLPLGAAQAKTRAIGLLEKVQIPDAARRFDHYPHQFSGGMRQRVLTAMAIALDPKVLIADEPTTALDVTVQAQVLDLIDGLRRDTGMAVVLITHDLGIVARHADRMAVMYAGRLVEQGTVTEVFARPSHPYTISLLRSVPNLDEPAGQELMSISGTPPLPGSVRQGCAFEARCYLGKGREACRTSRPALQPVDGGEHRSACHFSETLTLEARAA